MECTHRAAPGPGDFPREGKALRQALRLQADQVEVGATSQGADCPGLHASGECEHATDRHRTQGPVRSLGGEPAGAMAPMVSSQQFSPALGHMFLLTSLTGGDDRRGVTGCAENWALMARTSP